MASNIGGVTSKSNLCFWLNLAVQFYGISSNIIWKSFLNICINRKNKSVEGKPVEAIIIDAFVIPTSHKLSFIFSVSQNNITENKNPIFILFFAVLWNLPLD